MAVRFDLETEGLESALARLPAAFDRAMHNAVDGVVQAIVAEARRTTLFTDRTGMLRRSIIAAPVEGTFSQGNLRSKVTAGTAAGAISAGTVRYARFVHDGTKAHTIYPLSPRRTEKARLRFKVGGGYVFARKVDHPGTRPRPYMDEAVKAVRPRIPALVSAWTTAAIRQAGLS